jgi:regulatory protein
MAIITALTLQKRNPQRVNVELDGTHAFGVTALVAATLHKGQVLEEAAIAALRQQDEIDQSLDAVGRWMSYRPRTEREVRQYLRERQVSAEAQAAIIAALHQRGYLDDAAFARFWVQGRQSSKPLGPLALRQELRLKGVPNEEIEAALSEVNATDAAQRAAEGLVRRWRAQTLTQATFIQKLIAHLQRRGFAFGVARQTARQLADELAHQTPPYFLSGDSGADLDVAEADSPTGGGPFEEF